MAVLSGKDGTLFLGGEETVPVSNWKLNRNGNAKAYGANTTFGAKKRVGGTKDSTGSFLVRCDDTSNCPVYEQQEVTAQFHVDDSGDNYHEVDIFIESIEEDVDIDDGSIVGYAVTWGGNGRITDHGCLAYAAPSSSGA